jgi:hypothetical protein
MILNVLLNLQNQYLTDVCITSSPDKIIQSGVVHLGISDHSLIYATRKLNSVIKGRMSTTMHCAHKQCLAAILLAE